MKTIKLNDQEIAYLIELLRNEPYGATSQFSIKLAKNLQAKLTNE